MRTYNFIFEASKKNETGEIEKEQVLKSIKDDNFSIAFQKAIEAMEEDGWEVGSINFFGLHFTSYTKEQLEEANKRLKEKK